MGRLPLWYHLTFLLMLAPLVWTGARLGQRAVRKWGAAACNPIVDILRRAWGKIMKPGKLWNRLAVAAVVAWSTTGFSAVARAPIVGTWIVKDEAAPFPYHMYVFNADGTMQQANPDAGDPKTSDSDGKGVWVATGKGIGGKWVEIIADRQTHKFVGFGEITYELMVEGDRFAGTESFRLYNEGHALVDGPFPSKLFGTRVTTR